MINGDPMVTLSEDRSREIERRVRLLRWGFVALTVMVLVLSLIMHRWQHFAVAGLSGLGALLTAWAHGGRGCGPGLRGLAPLAWSCLMAGRAAGGDSAFPDSVIGSR